MDQFGEWTNFVVGVWAHDDPSSEDTVGRFHVSTYFVGLDLRGRLPWGPNPLIWETWVKEIYGHRQVDYLGHATRAAAFPLAASSFLQIKRGIYKPTGRGGTPTSKRTPRCPTRPGNFSRGAQAAPRARAPPAHLSFRAVACTRSRVAPDRRRRSPMYCPCNRRPRAGLP